MACHCKIHAPEKIEKSGSCECMCISVQDPRSPHLAPELAPDGAADTGYEIGGPPYWFQMRRKCMSMVAVSASRGRGSVVDIERRECTVNF